MAVFREYDSDQETVLVPGALRGYRCWRLTHDGELHSLNANCVWPGPTLVAQCLPFREHSEAPRKDCSCGIYALHHPVSSPFTAMFGHDEVPLLAPGQVIPGIIEATGRARLGTTGFRAEKARVLALAYQPVTQVLIDTADVVQEPAIDVTSFLDPSPRSIPGERYLICNGYISLRHLIVQFRVSIPPDTAIELPVRRFAQELVRQELERLDEQIRTRYPGVPLFGSMDRMLAEYPPLQEVRR